jgi:hypothetical protein
MTSDGVKLFNQFGEKQVMDILKQALIKGADFGLDKTFDIIDVRIKNNAILVYYESKTQNKFAVYSDFAAIIGFIHGFLASEFDAQKIYHIGVQSKYDNKDFIYILSPIESAKAIAQGNPIYWLNNSIVNEQVSFPKEICLLVEGESELAVFPILFNSINVDVDQYKIKLLQYSKYNLKTMLWVLNNKKDTFYLVCDKDKEKEIADLKREGLLNTNYHVLQEGELEDYIDPQSLIKILKTFTPDITLNQEYIDANRLRGIGTSKIIAKFYHEESIQNQNPAKPDVAGKIATHWVQNEIPNEFVKIMNCVLDTSST